MAFPTLAQDKLGTPTLIVMDPVSQHVVGAADSANNIVSVLRANFDQAGDTIMASATARTIVGRRPLAQTDYSNAPIGSEYIELSADSGETDPFETDRWVKGAFGWRNLSGHGRKILDPGNGGAIPVLCSGLCLIVTAAAETRTLAIPQYVGQEIVLTMKTDGGDAVITVASAFNTATNTIITFNDIGDIAYLIAVDKNSTLAWKAVCTDGSTLG